MHVARAVRGSAGQDYGPPQKLQGDAGAHDINDGIQRAYLVKMNRFERFAVNFRLCGADFEEEAYRALLDPGRESGGFYDLPYLRETPMRAVLMWLPVLVFVRMLMSVPVVMFMGVFMSVPVVMFMLMMMGLLMPVLVFMFVGMFVLMHIQVGAGDALDNPPLRMEMPAIQAELLQLAVEDILRDTHINQGRQEHIAADSADDV